jgi:hypothetical protein
MTSVLMVCLCVLYIVWLVINREEKRDAVDVRLCDFDETAYRVIVDAKERDTLRV